MGERQYQGILIPQTRAEKRAKKQSLREERRSLNWTEEVLIEQMLGSQPKHSDTQQMEG
jgi:hypothetical protein